MPPSLLQYVSLPSIAFDYDRYHAGCPVFRIDVRIVDRLLRKPGRVLDLGCGTGRMLVHLARRGFATVGVDLSPFMLQRAAEKAARCAVECGLVLADIRDLACLADGAFEYVICMFGTFGMLEGGEERMKVLNEVYRLLKPGGTFVFHVYNRFHGFPWNVGYLFRNAVDVVRGCAEWGDLWVEEYRGIPGMYMHLFGCRELADMFGRASLRVEGWVFADDERVRAECSRPVFAPRCRNVFVYGRPAV